MVSNTYCFEFLFCFALSCVPYVAVSLYCPILIAPSVFSNVYSQSYQISVLSPEYETPATNNYAIRIYFSTSMLPF